MALSRASAEQKVQRIAREAAQPAGGLRGGMSGLYAARLLLQKTWRALPARRGGVASAGIALRVAEKRGCVGRTLEWGALLGPNSGGLP